MISETSHYSQIKPFVDRDLAKFPDHDQSVVSVEADPLGDVGHDGGETVIDNETNEPLELIANHVVDSGNEPVKSDRPRRSRKNVVPGFFVSH